MSGHSAVAAQLLETVSGTGCYTYGDDQTPALAKRAALALAQEQALSAPPLVARTQHWWARALIRRGEPERAPALIESARATASELGMTHLVAQLDELTASL